MSMSWCKDCQAEYRDNFARCPICHSKLVAERPAEETWEDVKPELAFLVKAESTLQKDLLETALREAGIPCICREAGLGQAVRIVTGMVSFEGADLYVHPDHLTLAIHVVQTVLAKDLPPFEEAELEAAYDDYMASTPDAPVPPEAFETPEEEPQRQKRIRRFGAGFLLWRRW